MEVSAEEGLHLLKLSDIYEMYERKLGKFANNIYNKTHLKEQLFKQFESEALQEQSDGKHTILTVSE